ncbi:hypothetical protein ORV05_27280 [Amycolatopsis cynarae]|uniref:Lipoprotein n=1 Tax=Amycolatopsis cynarae TaxID=2995223 RepID=A0ABY7AX84_9PSEU|nr:hypothetical protein [Amycolatopsis sp. HUAS 11-8]WAL64637.1 hypothetical protein ORV05_27280 [Amycolatopsis sp. HUAS 11-8]
MLGRSGTGLLAVALLASGCADFRAVNTTREESRDFPFHNTKLVIENEQSDLRLVPGTAGTVQVRRSLHGKATLEGNASWTLVDGRLRLGATCSGFVPGCGSLNVVAVPPETAVEVTSDGGPVRSAGFAGDLTANVTRGWLRVEDPVGTLRLRCSNATVRRGA